MIALVANPKRCPPVTARTSTFSKEIRESHKLFPYLTYIRTPFLLAGLKLKEGSLEYKQTAVSQFFAIVKAVRMPVHLLHQVTGGAVACLSAFFAGWFPNTCLIRIAIKK